MDNEPEPRSGPSTVQTLLIAGVVALVAVGSTLGGLFYLGVIPASASQAPAGEEVEAEAEPMEPKEAVYIPVLPEFTANFEKPGAARFLQVRVELMTRTPEVEDMVKLHMPAIRNDLLMLFSSRSSDSVATAAGKEALRGEALEVVQRILEGETGKKSVDAVFFTSFVTE